MKENKIIFEVKSYLQSKGGSVGIIIPKPIRTLLDINKGDIMCVTITDDQRIIAWRK